MPLLYSGGRAAAAASRSNRFVELTATNPARPTACIRARAAIAVGSDADLVIWDEREVVLRNADAAPRGRLHAVRGQTAARLAGADARRAARWCGTARFHGPRRARAASSLWAPTLRPRRARGALRRSRHPGASPLTAMCRPRPRSGGVQTRSATLPRARLTTMSSGLRSPVDAPALRADPGRGAPPLCAAPRRRRTTLKLKVIGQPLATGLIQKNKEQPFFENFAAEDRAADRRRLQADRHAGHQGHRAAARDEGRPVRHRLAARVAELARRARPCSAWTWSAPAPTTRPAARSPRPTSTPLDAAAAAAVQRQAARRLAVRPADPVLQEADHQAGRHQGHEGARLRPEPGQVHRTGRRHAGADLVRRHAPVAVAGRGRLRRSPARARPTRPAGPR